MATKTHVEMIDDLTGQQGEDVKEREFAIDGVAYSIDLSEANWNELVDVMGVYVENGRKLAKSGKPFRKVSSGSKYSRETSAQMRSWARSNGWPDLADRGRVPNNVVEAWEQAHPTARAA